MARHLADSGVDPKRISGKGAGIDKTVGRAIVVSLDVGPLPASPPEPLQSPSSPTSRYGQIHPIGAHPVQN